MQWPKPLKENMLLCAAQWVQSIFLLYPFDCFINFTCYNAGLTSTRNVLLYL